MDSSPHSDGQNGSGSGSGSNGYSTNGSGERRRILEVPHMQSLITSQEQLQEMERLLNVLHLQPGPTDAEAPAATGKVGDPVILSSNAHGVKFLNPTRLYVYAVEVRASISPTKEVIFSKPTKDDVLVQERRSKCTHIFERIMFTHSDTFREPDIHWYNGLQLLISSINFFETKSQNLMKEFTVPGRELHYPELSTLNQIFFKLTPWSANYVINISKEFVLQQTLSTDLHPNQTALRFLEMAINQYVERNLGEINPIDKEFYSFDKGRVYLRHPQKYLFTEQDCPQVGDGVRLYIGAAKTLALTEGPKGRGNESVALIVDSKKAGFHVVQSLVSKVGEILGHLNWMGRLLDMKEHKLVDPICRGLVVETEYRGRKDRHYILKFAKVTAHTAEFSFQRGNEPPRQISVYDYFAQEYGINLEHPDTNLVHAGNAQRSYQIPIELCKVVEGQRVKFSQQSSKQVRNTTKVCAVPPIKRIEDTRRIAEAMAIFEPSNPYIRNAGVELVPQPMKLRGRQLNPPTVIFRERSRSNEKRLHRVTPQEGKWKFHYEMARACELNSWTLCAFFSLQTTVVRDLIENFAERIRDAAAKMGVEIDMPSEIKVLQLDQSECQNAVRGLLLEASTLRRQFMFFISDDSLSPHTYIKYYERQFMVRTQNMKLSNVKKVVQLDKKLLLQNVFLKTNVKNGGLNYVLQEPHNYVPGTVEKWIAPNRIIIGIGLSHAPPAFRDSKGNMLKDVPSVFGYACNMRSNPFEFTGGFHYQSKGREECLVIGNILEDVLSAYKDEHNGQLPNELIVYRASASEGSWKTLLSHEVQLLRGSFRQLSGGIGGQRITFINVSKAHNVRIFPEKINAADLPPKQNIPAGIVIDSQLTHPRYKQFYLNSHNTIQGSAKTPCYTILVDDLNFSMDDIVGLTNTLAYAHQIVGLPTSLPTPLYVASRYAERGRMLLTQQLENDIIHDEGVDARTSEERKHALSNGNGHGWGSSPENGNSSSSNGNGAHAQQPAMSESGGQMQRPTGMMLAAQASGLSSSQESSPPGQFLPERKGTMSALVRPIHEFTEMLNYAGTHHELFRINA